MEALTRKSLQGVTNIIRFNWHYYVVALVVIALLVVTKNLLPAYVAYILITPILATIFISLSVSYYIYDYSNIYKLSWLDELQLPANNKLLNIHAGFDETSMAIQNKYPLCRLSVFDFYDPALHTEISIERARKAYPAYAGTIRISTGKLPALAPPADAVFLIFAAHEIRNSAERIRFFQQLKNNVADNGVIVVTEHLRNTANLMAYNIGVFHFLPETEWLLTFKKAGLTIEKRIFINPFVVTYFLKKDGNTP